jgi:hypothetical protein
LTIFRADGDSGASLQVSSLQQSVDHLDSPGALGVREE